MSELDQDLKYELKELIEKLSSIRGRGTELISVYIPDKFPIHDYASMLNTERSLAVNIKSKQTRKNVLGALEKIIGEFKKYKQTPKNGLIIFCGNTGGERENIEMWTIIPPTSLNHKLYRCDQIFWLDPLKEMVEDKEEVLIVSIDKQEMAIALIKGKKLVLMRKDNSHIPGKFRAGGQSAARFQRQREEAKKSFLKETGSEIQKVMNKRKLKKIILGGPGAMKEELNDERYLGGHMKSVIGLIDSGYSGIDGFEEILSKSEEILDHEAMLDEKKNVQEFLEMLAKNPNKAAYGYDDVNEKLTNGVVKTIYLGEKINKEIKKTLIQTAERYGTEVLMISDETNEGQTLHQLGGIGAILRYEIRN